MSCEQRTAVWKLDNETAESGAEAGVATYNKGKCVLDHYITYTDARRAGLGVCLQTLPTR